jgi:transcription elongation factor Elf1
MAKITRERAEKVARAHACENCGEYNYKKLSVKPAPATNRTELNEAWVAKKTCGVCGLEALMGIDDEGEIVWVTQP